MLSREGSHDQKDTVPHLVLEKYIHASREMTHDIVLVRGDPDSRGVLCRLSIPSSLRIS